MAMDQIVYWLAVYIGIVSALFVAMNIGRIIARVRRMRRPERTYERSVTPILRFNLRKHYVPEIRTSAEHSLEHMEPGDTTYKLREALLNHDTATRVAAEALGHIEAGSGSRNARRRSRAESKGRMRI